MTASPPRLPPVSGVLVTAVSTLPVLSHAVLRRVKLWKYFVRKKIRATGTVGVWERETAVQVKLFITLKSQCDTCRSIGAFEVARRRVDTVVCAQAIIPNNGNNAREVAVGH